MTATHPTVREAAARAWSLIADRRTALPLGVALDMVTDTGCERDTAFIALRGAARDALLGAKLPGGIFANPDQWAVCARDMLHVLGAPSVRYAEEQLLRAEAYRARLIYEQTRRTGLDNKQWRDRADWLAWADEARLVIEVIRGLAEECSK